MAIGLKLGKTFTNPYTKTEHQNPYLKIGDIQGYSLDNKTVNFYVLVYSSRDARRLLALPDYTEFVTVLGDDFLTWFNEDVLSQSNITIRKRIYNYLFQSGFESKINWEDWEPTEID